MAPLSPALLAVLLALAPAQGAWAQLPADPESVKARLSVYEKGLGQDLDPGFAEAFLGDRPLQEALKGRDPDRLARLFTLATQLKDLREVLLTHRQAHSLNPALRARLLATGSDSEIPGLPGLGSEPRRLLAWARKYAPLLDPAPLARALWEWDTLSADQKAWLAGERVGSQEWEGRSFAKRQEMLELRGQAIYADLMAFRPRTQADYRRMRDAQDDIEPALDDDRRQLLGEHLAKARSSLEALEELQGRPGLLKDPRFRGLIEQARNAGTVDEALGALAQVFDRAGIPNKSLQLARPLTPEERFSDGDRQALQGMLATALLSEIAHSETGRRVAEFYKTHPLDLRLKELPGRVGQYSNSLGQMIINEKLVSEWLKGGKRLPRDLLKDQAALRDLALMLSASFVHEATHQRQHAWATENKVMDLYGQHQELEAMSVQALYIVQQSAARPDYRRYLETRQDASWVAQMEASFGQQLRRSPRLYRQYVMTDQYPDTPSLEASAARRTEFYTQSLGVMDAELERRAALPADQRAALETGGADDVPEDLDYENWRRALLTLRTGKLKEASADFRRYRGEALEAYHRHRERYEKAILEVDDALSQASRGPAPRREPPVPAGGLR